jgi:hypothetical protein
MPDSLNSKVQQAEETLKETKHSIVQSKMQMPHRKVVPTSTVSEVTRIQFERLEMDIPGLIEKARARIVDSANQETAKIQATMSSSTSEKVVVNKAAALLAERMAALGVKSSVATTPTTTKADPAAEALTKIETEKSQKLRELDAIEGRYRDYLGIIKSFLQIDNARRWQPSPADKLKYEQGIGLISKIAKEIFEELQKVEPPKPTTVQVVNTSYPTVDLKPMSSTPTAAAVDPMASAMKQAEQAILAARERSSSLMNSTPTIPQPVSSNPFDAMISTASKVPQVQSAVIPEAKQSPVTAEPQRSFDAIKKQFNQPPVEAVKEKPKAPVPAKKPFVPVQQPETKSTMPATSANHMPSARSPASIGNPFQANVAVPTTASPVPPVVNKAPVVPPASSPQKGSVPTFPPTSPKSEIRNAPIASPTVVPTPGPPPPAPGGLPPPPPPPPPVASDGSVAPIKIATATNDNEIGRKSSAKPKPADVGGQGINFAEMLRNAQSLKQTSTMKKSEVEKPLVSAPLSPVNVPTVASTAEVPKPVPTNVAVAPVVQPVAATPTIQQQSSSPVGYNPFAGFTPTQSAPVTADTAAKSPDKSPWESDWEVVQKDAIVELEPYEVVVEFDFDGTGADDLPAKTGSPLWVEKEDGEWIFCKDATGKTGWIPLAFVAKKVAKPNLPLTPLCKARVLFDFDARNEDEISCIVGDVVDVLDKSEGSWWKVQLIRTQGIGLIPSNFLEELGQDSKDSLNAYDDESPAPGSGGGWPGNSLGIERLKIPGSSGDSLDGSSECKDLNPFGSTFALVATPSTKGFPDIAMDEPPSLGTEERNRSEAIQEMIETEQSYFEDMNIILEQFFKPMSGMNIRIDVLFANFLAVLDVSHSLLRDFEGMDVTRDPIGSVFLSHLDDLSAYRIYCENMSTAIDYLQKVRVQNPTVQNFLKVSNEICVQ